MCWYENRQKCSPIFLSRKKLLKNLGYVLNFQLHNCTKSPNRQKSGPTVTSPSRFLFPKIESVTIAKKQLVCWTAEAKIGLVVASTQGCQMVCFHTKNWNFGIVFRPWNGGYLVYFMAI
jgi:hypothetical protein